MSQPSIPVISLTVLGALIAIIGLFAAGNIVIVIVGLGAIFGAGIIGVAERLAERRQSPPIREEEQ